MDVLTIVAVLALALGLIAIYARLARSSEEGSAS
jgi:hypothetical protein